MYQYIIFGDDGQFHRLHYIRYSYLSKLVINKSMTIDYGSMTMPVTSYLSLSHTCIFTYDVCSVCVLGGVFDLLSSVYFRAIRVYDMDLFLNK